MAIYNTITPLKSVWLLLFFLLRETGRCTTTQSVCLSSITSNTYPVMKHNHNRALTPSTHAVPKAVAP